MGGAGIFVSRDRPREQETEQTADLMSMSSLSYRIRRPCTAHRGELRYGDVCKKLTKDDQDVDKGVVSSVVL